MNLFFMLSINESFFPREAHLLNMFMRACSMDVNSTCLLIYIFGAVIDKTLAKNNSNDLTESIKEMK